jgi:hypothetical protein
MVIPGVVFDLTLAATLVDVIAMVSILLIFESLGKASKWLNAI